MAVSVRGSEEGGCALTEVIVPLAHVVSVLKMLMTWVGRIRRYARRQIRGVLPREGRSTREAKRVCRSCEVQAECLEYALENDERFGIWGGCPSENDGKSNARPSRR